MTPLIPFPPDSPWTSPTEDTDLPYDFVQVALENGAAKDEPTTPVWHDGANSDQDELHSGELRCTLRALSPLLVANQQVAISQLEPAVRSRIESAAAVVGANAPANGEHAEKKVLFPLTLGKQGAVLIPGESLKGMLRHALGALLSSPMERVQHETFSYRPNARVDGHAFKTRACGARVMDWDKDRLLLKIRLIEDIASIEFVHGECPKGRTGPINAGDTLARGAPISNKTRQTVRDGRHKWSYPPVGSPLEAKCVYLCYHFALDQDRHFMDVAGKGRGTDHPGAFVPAAEIATTDVVVDPAVVRQYLDTFEHLSDAQSGHLSRRNRDEKAKIKTKVRWPDLAKNDLIFCEWLLPASGRPGQVISFGHNFRYRWKHLDSVTTIAVAFDGSHWTAQRRPEISAHPDEKPEAPPPGAKDEPQPPAALSAQRNLFGYVVVAPASALENHYGALSTLRDPFNRLAGRVSFNIGMERLKAGDDDKTRFVNHDSGGFLFLHPAVSPKPSFSRSYVPGRGRTWGDGVALNPLGGANQVYALQNGTRAFAGRKFFPHQFAWEGRLILKRYHYDLIALLQAAEAANSPTACSRAELVQFLWSTQSAVAAYVSRPGREFGFTVRFKDLRAWELAALAVTLSPATLVTAILKDTNPGLLNSSRQHLLGRVNSLQGSRAPLHSLGHKLGRGKAMGMGSVQIAIDECPLWRKPAGTPEKLERDDLSAMVRKHLLSRLDDASTVQWLKVHQILPERVVGPYPYLLHRGARGKPQGILAWAQQERAQQMAHARNGGFG